MEFRGVKEVFKSDKEGEGLVSDIKLRCTVNKMQEYVKLTQEEKQSEQ